MNDLFVGGADGGEDAAELRAGGIDLTVDEIVGTETHAAVVDKFWFMEALKEIGRCGSAGEGFVHGRAPFGV